MICQSTQELVPEGTFASFWNQVKKTTKNRHAAIFEVKFRKKKAKGVITESRERKADTLFNDLESVAFAIEDNDLNITENNFVPTAKCNQDTTERQLVSRSGLQRLQCCVCHLHHEQAMKSPLRVRQFFKTMLQQMHHFKVDVIAGDANAAAYKYIKKQQHQDVYNSSVAVLLRESNVRSTRGAHLKADFILIIIPIITFLNLAQQVISLVASWLFSHGENHLDPES